MTEAQQDGLIMALIERAALAGAYRVLARDIPAHASGFLKLADRQGAEVAALCQKVVEREAEWLASRSRPGGPGQRAR